MTKLLLIVMALVLTACSGPCPYPLTYDYLGQCSQRGGM